FISSRGVLGLGVSMDPTQAKAYFGSLPLKFLKLYCFEVQWYPSQILHDFQNIFHVADPYELINDAPKAVALIGIDSRFMYKFVDNADGTATPLLFQNETFINVAEKFMRMTSVSHVVLLREFVEMKSRNLLACLLRHEIGKFAHPQIQLRCTSASAHMYAKLIQAGNDNAKSQPIENGPLAFYATIETRMEHEIGGGG
ncbi:UNVERIFIED_CONTAM: hypothetical protein HDU68_005372, partial [Siphonaria sp. JEL0065]